MLGSLPQLYVVPQSMRVLGDGGSQRDSGVVDGCGSPGGKRVLIDFAGGAFRELTRQKLGIGGETRIVNARHGQFADRSEQFETSVKRSRSFERQEQVDAVGQFKPRAVSSCPKSGIRESRSSALGWSLRMAPIISTLISTEFSPSRSSTSRSRAWHS